MGVTSLWTVVQPCARPIKIETLNRKRLAVDASIWIYQFLKAVRDKEGNALRNSHVVGFFRRICKLLFFGIKPVFVFDGGAPALKRQTISGRKARREGRREDAVRTAGKLLALQMQRRAEEEEQKRKDSTRRPADRDEAPLPEDLVYVDELQMTQQERQQNRKFKKKDQYHLPDLDAGLAELAGPNDPRVMSLEDLEQYARQFDAGEDINVYDFSKIDFNSPFFMSLPASDRYNILNAARLRSRLRMGHTKEQLDNMFPDRMAFSRFQIERVTERNELTQRLMHVSGMTDDSMFNGSGRVAGEKGREYVLVKNDGVEGGWALGVIGDKDKGEREKPIDVDVWDTRLKQEGVEEDEDDEDDGFEDVPIEGLNRLPKLQNPPKVSATESASRSILQKRTAEYAARRRPNRTKPTTAPSRSLNREESNTLFVGGDSAPVPTEAAAQDREHDSDEEELQRAIAMSLEGKERASSPDDDDFEEVFHERMPEQQGEPPHKSRNGTKPATLAAKAAASSLPFQDDSDDDTMDLAGAIAESRKSRHQPHPVQHESVGAANLKPRAKEVVLEKPAFDGPLPFERLDLGSSLLGRKKAQQLEEEREGGFEKGEAVANSEKKSAAPAPPWFSGDIQKDLDAQKVVEEHDRMLDRQINEAERTDFQPLPRLQPEETVEVVDVDAIPEKPTGVITVDSSDDEMEDHVASPELIIEDTELRMGDLADKIRAEPPIAQTEPQKAQADAPPPRDETPAQEAATQLNRGPPEEKQSQNSDEEEYEWEASDKEDPLPHPTPVTNISKPAGGVFEPAKSQSPNVEFENADIPKSSLRRELTDPDMLPPFEDDDEGLIPPSGVADDQAPPEDDSDAREYYSDAEDEELMTQLAIEAEEHARFASQLNQRSQRQNMEEYERELKNLRSQQKKDRRDADEVTQAMITECQQLLKLFGLPYITAPMEAEAQCAELVSLGLVDGIVTDDSDIFLFGGTRVYKNMFNQAKFVECYLTADLEREFDLTRVKLIALANLLGSDYTEGLPGVGPVTALEIISEFPQGLESFREWWTRVQTGAPATEIDNGSAFRRKFRRGQATKLFLAPGFPDKRVEKAYLQPEVDSDPSEFLWGVPDLDALRGYLMATIGWSQERTDEVLVPVIKDMNRRDVEGTQANITQFLGGGGAGRGVGGATVGVGAFAPRKKAVGKSKRMDEALERMAGRARKRRKTGAGGGASDDQDEENGEYGAAELLAGEDAIVAQPGSVRERPGLVGIAEVIPVSASARKGTGAAKQRQNKSETKAKAAGRVKSAKRKAAVHNEDDADSANAAESDMDVSDESESAPKKKKKKSAKQKGKAKA